MHETAQARRGRPRGSTRERILDIALELFNEQGYEKTSLREIAERLGITKAALYYHFEHKEDILLELHLRLHALGRDAIERVGGLDMKTASSELWAQGLDEFIDQVVTNRDLFLLHERNHGAFQELAQSEHHAAEHHDLEQVFRSFLADPEVPLERRVRMACSIGAVFGALMGAGDAFGAASMTDVSGIVRTAVRELMDNGEAPAKASSRQAAAPSDPSSPRKRK